MARGQDIDRAMRGWPFQPGVISARMVKTASGREVIQMRVELGVLQMETADRPDGQEPEGHKTYLSYLLAQAEGSSAIDLTEEQCAEIDREFVQFYHRRICWLALREFDRAVADADHTIALMDFVVAHSTDEDWIVSHEQYRPFVLFHRTQAAALAHLEKSGAQEAVEEIDRGVAQMRQLAAEDPDEEPFDSEQLVEQLVQLKEWLREHYQLGRTLSEQLAEAVAAEQYELAAQLRDQIAQRGQQV